VLLLLLLLLLLCVAGSAIGCLLGCKALRLLFVFWRHPPLAAAICIHRMQVCLLLVLVLLPLGLLLRAAPDRPLLHR
jgi:hypothetical protein